MNIISPISFTSRSHNEDSVSSKDEKRQKISDDIVELEESREKERDKRTYGKYTFDDYDSEDSFEKSDKKKKSDIIRFIEKVKDGKITQKEKNIFHELLGAFQAALIFFAANGLSDIVTQNSATEYNSMGHTVKEVSEWIDCPSEVLEIINDVEGSDVLRKVTLPDEYREIEVEINKKELKLEKYDINSDERFDIEDDIKHLEKIKSRRDRMGKTYLDPNSNMAYIYLKGLYPIEDVCEAWGIEEKDIIRYNDPKYRENKFKVFLTEDSRYENSEMKHLTGMVIVPKSIIKP